MCPRANEPDRVKGASTLLFEAEFVDIMRANLGNDSEEKDESGISGSRSKPEVHIRPKASILLRISGTHVNLGITHTRIV